MADIQINILKKYGIDIAQENILKLYKIEDCNISEQDIEAKIQDARKRWNTSINGANQKNAERDKERLEKADSYESILRNAKLRKELFKYYNKASGNAGSNAGNTESVEFAREYFKIISTTKKIRKSDVDFFFKYYQSERKNKKAILEMLNKEFRVAGIGKENSYDDENEDVDGKKMDEDTPLVVNLFSEATILKIRRAIEKYDEAIKSAELCQYYPKLQEGLYEYLEIKEIEDAKQFVKLMSQKGQEVFNVRQEKGAEYIPLVDMFNILQTVGEYKDVADNMQEFKLLLKYPNLTPYMFSFIEMKPETLKEIVRIAGKDYGFRDNTDFILNYYLPIHDNFGISDGSIGSIIKKAQKNAKQNKILNELDEKLGKNKKRSIPFGAEIIHWLVYWPIFVAYLVFEVAKVIFTHLHKLVIPLFIVLFVLTNWLIPRKIDVNNFLILRKIINFGQWSAYLEESLGYSVNNIAEWLLATLMELAVLTIGYVLLPLAGAYLLAEFSEKFNKMFDWIGYQRTFENILKRAKDNTEKQYKTHKKLFMKNKIPKIIVNFCCLAFVSIAIIFASNYFRDIKQVNAVNKEAQETQEAIASLQDDEAELPTGPVMVITVSSANIRSGVGTDYEVVATAKEGETFISTGRQETASNGRIWYEIYLDEDKTSVGWASQKVIAEE